MDRTKNRDRGAGGIRRSMSVCACLWFLSLSCAAVTTQQRGSAGTPRPTCVKPGARSMEPALRLISTAPAVTETLFDLGLGSNLVGRSSGCLHPVAALALPVVGPYSAPSLERVLALRPTHLLETYLADPAMSNRLERAGVHVLHFPCDRLADIPKMRAQLAALCGGETPICPILPVHAAQDPVSRSVSGALVKSELPLSPCSVLAIVDA